MLLNPNESSKEKMDIAAELINLHSNTLEYLKKTERALINSISIIKFNDPVNIFKCYLVHHSILRS
ncbi:MAG: hypothetical protein CEE42_01835 [Promethearchaeota archaeon Loki_b31]|nr:MAG: hypothetical protein CEE42_01835 [Candidatus Lokiarchaeota archaeon Loki_b31]